MSRRQKLDSGGLFDSLVHFIRGQKDDYFTGYKTTLVCDHGEGGSGNVVRNVENYVEVGIAKREMQRLHFSSCALNRPCDLGAASRTALAGKAFKSI